MKNLAYPIVTATQSLDGASAVLKPETPEGDAFFGLVVGTNGTAAMSRRECVEAQITTATPIEWARHDGRPAVGVTLVPSSRGDRFDPNPWSGR